MTSPCKDCERRTLGCHNVDTCDKWRDYVEARKKASDQKAETVRQCNDWERHLRRHGCKLPRR